MQALVLIGGFGTRLRPVTYQVPKQLIPIAGKPMLYHVLDLLPSEVDNAVLATGYKADAIEAYVRRVPPRIRVRTVPETDPLGTGGGMRNAGGEVSDPFLLLNSDVISGIDVEAVVRSHRQRGGIGTMVLTEVKDPSPYGVAELDAQDRIRRFLEKPKPEETPSRWINAGIGVWNRGVLDQIPRGRPVSFETEILPGLLSRGVFGFRSRGFWEDAGTPQRLLHAQQLLFDAGRATSRDVPPVAFGSGPVAMGAGAEVAGARFGRYVTVDDGVRVGPEAYLENAVVMAGARIGAGARVVDSLIGPDVDVAPGAVVTGQVLATAAGPT
ncbi:MAG: NDP-sugar synthase [Thermoplasmata archaeon]